jgi:hypothetical protein
MKYEVRAIETGKFGAVLLETDDRDTAKRYAEDQAWDTNGGTAIIDTESGMADLGDRIIPVGSAFEYKP